MRGVCGAQPLRPDHPSAGCGGDGAALHGAASARRKLASGDAAAVARRRLDNFDESSRRIGNLHAGDARHTPGRRRGDCRHAKRRKPALDPDIRQHLEMSLFSNTSVLLGKELRTEFRSRELLTTTVVFILMVVVLFSFTFDPTREESRRYGPGLLWLPLRCSAALMLQPGFLREQTNDTLSALRLSVSDPFALFLSKLVANTLVLLLIGCFRLPVFVAIYNVPILPMLALSFF